MKTIFNSAFILFLAITLFSCSDDDTSFSLAGVYVLTQESVTGCDDPADNSNETKSCSASDCETLTLNSNGTFTDVEIDNGVTTTTEGTYTVNGNAIVFSYLKNGVLDTDEAIYTLNGSVLTITYGVDSDNCVEIDTYQEQ